MSTIIPLGKLAADDAGRDAIHIAVAPVVASVPLSPGEHVGIAADGMATKLAVHIGIVDPYLKDVVLKGERFYLCLYPNTITSLRHHWVHPAFKIDKPDEEDLRKETSRKWIEDFAAIGKFDYSEFMEAAKASISSGEYLICQGFDTPDEYYNMAEFWKHYAVMTGVAVDGNPNFVGCSC